MLAAMSRLFCCCLLVALALPAGADEIYRVVRPDGSVVYTDRAPDRQARPLRLGPVSGSTPAAGRPRSAFYSPELLRQAARFAVRIESPTPGQIQAAGSPLVAAASVMPGLVKGFSLQYQIDGRNFTEAPSEALSLPIPPLAAGPHELVIVLLDPSGREVARSEVSRFELRP